MWKREREERREKREERREKREERREEKRREREMLPRVFSSSTTTQLGRARPGPCASPSTACVSGGLLSSKGTGVNAERCQRKVFKGIKRRHQRMLEVQRSRKSDTEEFQIVSGEDFGAKEGGSDRIGNEGSEEGSGSGSGSGSGNLTAVAGTTGVAVGGLALLIGLGALYKDDINSFLTAFSAVLEGWGPLGYVAYSASYILLEVLAVPAIPVTMSAGVLFGPILGTAIVSFSSTAAATISFLIARYVARDRVLEIAKKNKKFAAIDKALGKESFKVVLFLRLSPLLPFALSNYLYGLTSVNLGEYVLGSWIGMAPGTFAYVSAGNVGASVLNQASGAAAAADASGSPNSTALLVVGVAGTLLATTFLGRIVTKTLKELDIE